MLFVLSSIIHFVAEAVALVLPLRSKHPSFTGLFAKRSLAVSGVLKNLGNRYSVELNLGTPPQKVEVILDTYSSDFFLLDPRASVCKSRQCDSAIFDSSKSSTFVKTNSSFNVVYNDGSTVRGIFGNDQLQFDGVTLDNFTFAVAENSSTEITVGGIGLGINEYPFTSNQITEPYYNFPMLLKKHGYIQYISYSVWLNSWDETEGLINFGGVDERLVASDMYRFPVVESMYRDHNSFTIKLDAINFITYDLKRHRLAETSIPIVFDHGTAISRLPFVILEPLYDALQVNLNTFTVPCQKLSRGGGISLVFSGVEYVFKFRDIAAPIDETLENCIPGFWPDDEPLIGANFLRSLYVVYDLEKLELGLALANKHRSVSDLDPQVVEIVNGISGKKAPEYSNTKVYFQYKRHSIDFDAPDPATMFHDRFYFAKIVVPLGSQQDIFTPDGSVVLGDAYGIGIVTPYVYTATLRSSAVFTQLERKRSASLIRNID